MINIIYVKVKKPLIFQFRRVGGLLGELFNSRNFQFSKGGSCGFIEERVYLKLIFDHTYRKNAVSDKTLHTAHINE